MTFHLHQKNPVLRKGDEIYQGIYWLIVQASLVPLLSYTKCWEQLHPSLSAVISQTSGKSDKKHDERPVAGERLTRIIVHRYPKRKNSRNRNKLRAKSISSSYRRARFSLFSLLLELHSTNTMDNTFYNQFRSLYCFVFKTNSWE